MLREGLAMSPDEGVTAEMQEVEQELEEKEHLARQQGRRRSSISPYALEMGLGRASTRKSRSGSRLPSPPRSPSSSPERSPSPRGSNLKGIITGLHNLLSLLLSPAWVQTFVMTFLGEWGDRSQIATIAMAAGQDYWWVTGGAVSGHAVCTSVAVIGGRAIAGKVSLRVGKHSTHSAMGFRLTLDSNIRWCGSFPSLRCHLPCGSLLLRLNGLSSSIVLLHRKVQIICQRGRSFL
jgi:putative Ca2+/H+ antiporter (TMEM165/GDT1 family)